MSSEPVRDPVKDHLLTPRNCLLAIVDYQPIQVKSVKSMNREELVANVVRVAETATTYGLPIILSTVNVSNGANGPTVNRLTDALPGVEAIDRTTMKFVGRRRFPARRGGHGAHETRDGGALDRGVLDTSLVGHDASRVRDVPGRRRCRRHLHRGPSGRAGTAPPGWGASSELGAVRLRVAARLGPGGNDCVVQGDRLRRRYKIAAAVRSTRDRLARILVTADSTKGVTKAA